ncbi:MAG: hypothetical protein IH948_05330, partial [Bacteroidetes bacterium]|nr:hypothetical protein [Bacteroidota bacterium]
MKSTIIYLFVALATSYQTFAQNWVPLGAGLERQVECLYSDSNFLYVGTSHPVATDNALGVWNGTAWDTLGNGTGANVRAITKFQGELYAGGGLGIFKWDGVAWVVPGGGVDGAIFHLLATDTQLYAIGIFDSAGSQPASCIAKWNGSVWSAIDTTTWLTGISCAAFYAGDLYIGGNMLNGSLTIEHMARWDGTEWQNVGPGIVGGLSIVNDLQVYNGQLYAGGVFRKTEGSA